MISPKYQIGNKLDVLPFGNCSKFKVDEQIVNNSFHLQNSEFLSNTVPGTCNELYVIIYRDFGPKTYVCISSYLH